jgi:hypothetical protein
MADTNTSAGQAANGQESSQQPPPPQQQPPAGQPGFTREEVDRLLASARKEEKDKLYSELDTTRKRVQKLEQEKTDLESAIQTAQEDGRKTKKMEDRLADVEKQLTALPDRFSKVMDDTLDNMKKEGETARQRDQLAAQRERLIASSTELIPELVTGNTPEELQASFEKSKQTWKSIHDKAAETTRKEFEGSVRGALPPVTATGANNNAGGQPNADAAGGIEDWRKMAPSEWEQKKKQIKEEAFRKAGLPMKQGRA